MPATRRYKARNPSSSMLRLLWVECQEAHRATTCAAANSALAAVGWKTPRIELDSGLFTVRAAIRSTPMDRAAQQSGVQASPVEVRLGVGVGPSIELRPPSPRVPPHIVHPPALSCAGARFHSHEWLGGITDPPSRHSTAQFTRDRI